MSSVSPVRRAARRRLLARLRSLSWLVGLGPAFLTFAPRPARSAQAGLLIVGDSLSAEYGLRRGSGWVALLAQRLSSQRPGWSIFNASISGETTAGGASRIQALLAEHRPKVVVIELGGNDALRGLALEGTARNLDAMVAASQAAGARVLLLGMRMPPNYGRRYAEQFERLYRDVAASRKCALLPFFLEKVADRIDLFQPDRIHPTEQAQPILLENVWPSLVKLL